MAKLIIIFVVVDFSHPEGDSESTYNGILDAFTDEDQANEHAKHYGNLAHVEKVVLYET